MKKLGFIVINVILILMIFVGCREQSITTTTTTTGFVQTTTLPLNNSVDEKLIKELMDLVDRNKRCVFNMLYEGSLPCFVNDENDEVGVVQSDEFKTLEDIESFLLDTYTQDVVNAITDEFLLNENPVYYEVDGKLMVRRRWNIGTIGPWEECSIESVDRYADSCTFTILARWPDYISEGSFFAYRYEFNAVRVEGKWLLNSVVREPTQVIE